MKKIVVAVDFSEASQNAFYHALEWAHQLNYEVEVFHVYSGGLNGEKPRTNRSGLNLEESLLVDLNYLINSNEYMEEMTVWPAVKIKPVLVRGKIQQTILRRSAKEDCAMLVMGSTGIHRKRGDYWGSTSIGTANQAKSPVLLIPQKTIYQDIRKIVAVSSCPCDAQTILKKCQKLLHLFQADIDVIRIEKRLQVAALAGGIEFDRRNEMFTSEVERTVYADSISEGLENYAQQHRMDLIAIVTSPENSFLDVIQKNNPKEVFQTACPLLLLPH